MKSLDDYFDLRTKIFEHFGYVEGYRVIPLDDARDYFWRLNGDGPGCVRFAETVEKLNDGDCYQNEIYTQRCLPKWVYRGKELTMICVDTNTDGNKFLQVFDNAKESP